MKEGLLRIRVSIIHLSCWMLVNIGVATLPLWASIHFPLFQERFFFSSFLTYSFTFLIVSLYVFMVVSHKFFSLECFVFWIMLFIALIIGGTYLTFNYNLKFVEYVDKRLPQMISILLSVTIACAIPLHWRNLWEHIDKECAEKKKENAERLGKRVQDMEI